MTRTDPARSPDELGTGSAEPVVQITDAEAQLGGRIVWRDLALSVEPGQFVAVLGPNGAGKSTLLRVILGQVALSAGQARVLGAAPGTANSRIGYLPQRHGFDSSIRIRGVDLVRLGLEGTRLGVPLPRRFSSARRRREFDHVDDVIGLVDASAYAYRPIGELSGGEQQRLLIAQALVRSPQLLLLDEPLDSLDLPNQASVSALLSRVAAQQRVAVLLVAHDVNPIVSFIDRVAYLAAGHAISGTPESIISSERLSQLYGVPIDVLRTSDGRLVVVGSPEAPFVHGHRHRS
jgi:zinc/manganese transport system ATP-binding protein